MVPRWLVQVCCLLWCLCLSSSYLRFSLRGRAQKVSFCKIPQFICWLLDVWQHVSQIGLWWLTWPRARWRTAMLLCLVPLPSSLTSTSTVLYQKNISCIVSVCMSSMTWSNIVVKYVWKFVSIWILCCLQLFQNTRKLKQHLPWRKMAALANIWHAVRARSKIIESC